PHASIQTSHRAGVQSHPHEPGHASSPALTEVRTGLLGMVVRRCPTLPHRLRCSTIGAERLSFRVRYVSGRFPLAMAAVTLWRCQTVGSVVPHLDHTCVVWCGGGSRVCISGTTQWTRSMFVVKLSAY